jgi:hypothetical protein
MSEQACELRPYNNQPAGYGKEHFSTDITKYSNIMQT